MVLWLDLPMEDKWVESMVSAKEIKSVSTKGKEKVEG